VGFRGAGRRASGGLVVAAGGEHELTEGLAGGGVNDADVQVSLTRPAQRRGLYFSGGVHLRWFASDIPALVGVRYPPFCSAAPFVISRDGCVPIRPVWRLFGRRTRPLKYENGALDPSASAIEHDTAAIADYAMTMATSATGCGVLRWSGLAYLEPTSMIFAIQRSLGCEHIRDRARVLAAWSSPVSSGRHR